MKKSILKLLVFLFFRIFYTKGILPMEKYPTENRVEYIAYILLVTILTGVTADMFVGLIEKITKQRP